MCLQTSDLRSTARQRWDGEEIIHRPIIRAARFVPGTRKRFDIDIREFLSSTSNAVVLESCRAALAELPTSAQRASASSSRQGSFDLRVRAICSYLGKSLQYQRKRTTRGPDLWMFPDETLANGGGDCEDQAFLLAAMLLASGISGYVIRVALGTFRNCRTQEDFDHAWVMYKTESGHWIVLDPMQYTDNDAASVRAQPPTVATGAIGATGDTFEYVPQFVFNDKHLWSVQRHSGSAQDFEKYVRERDRFWDRFDPAFAASVHRSILDNALQSMSWVDRQYVNAVSLAVDADITTYDPRDHFDNGYISDGWRSVHARLKTGSLNDFALACHAIADFYAHSSWGVFGARIDGKLQPYDPNAPVWNRVPDYSEGGNMPFTDTSRFSTNERVWRGTRAEAAQAWAGKLISGRYAQNSDPHQGTIERLTYIPSGLRRRSDYHDRTCLPHHNEIAVDATSRESGHRLYTTDAAYNAAFAERYEAARIHIAQTYEMWQLELGRAPGELAAE